MTEPQPPQNPYHPAGGQPTPYGYRVAPDHPQATTILVLGILGMALCQIVAPFAWVMGGRARREIKESGGTIGGETQVTIGWALGIAGSVMLILGLLFVLVYVVIIVIFIGGTAASATY